MGYTRISNLPYDISAVCISEPKLSEHDSLFKKFKQELVDKTLRIEKLYHATLKLYAIELGSSERVIVTIENTLQYGTVINIREILPNHEYDKSSILSKKNIQHLVKLDGELSGGTTATTTTSSTNDNANIHIISKTSYHKKLLLDQDNAIIYDIDQTEIIDAILNIQNSSMTDGRTLLTHGLAGSGKTMVMLEAISQLSAGKYVIMVKSSKLLEYIKKLYSDVYQNQGVDVVVEFVSLKNDVSFGDFQRWYNGFCQINKNQYKLKNQNAAQLYSNMQKLALGQKSNNKQVKTVYAKYVKYLTQHNKIDSALSSDSNLFKGKFDDVQGIFIDEVYDFGQVEIQNITCHIPQYVNLYCFGDMHQALGGDYGGYIQSSMKNALHRQGLSEATEYNLIGSYRNSVTIKKLVANILDQARLVGKDDKDASDIILRDNNMQVETSGYHFTSIANDKTINSVRGSIIKGSNIAIIVNSTKSKMFVQEKFKLSSTEVDNHIYTVEESKGLEFDIVVLCNYLTDNQLDMDGFFRQHPHNKQLPENHSLPLSVSKLYVAIARAKIAITIIEDTKYFKRFEESYKPIISRGIREDGTVDVLAFDVDSTVNLIRQFINRSDFDKAEYRLGKLKQYIDQYAADKSNCNATEDIDDIEMMQVQYDSLVSLLAQQEQKAKYQERQHIADHEHVQQNLTKGTLTNTTYNTASHNSSSSEVHGINQKINNMEIQCKNVVKACYELTKPIRAFPPSTWQEMQRYSETQGENFDCVMNFLKHNSADSWFKWKGMDNKSIIDVLIETRVIERLHFKELSNNSSFVNYLAQYMISHNNDEYVMNLYDILDQNFIAKIRVSQEISSAEQAMHILGSKQKQITPEQFIKYVRNFQQPVTIKHNSKGDKRNQNDCAKMYDTFMHEAVDYFNSFNNDDFEEKINGNAMLIANLLKLNASEIINSSFNFPYNAVQHICYFIAFKYNQLQDKKIVKVFGNWHFLSALSQKHLLKEYDNLDENDASQKMTDKFIASLPQNMKSNLTKTEYPPKVTVLEKLLSNKEVYPYLDNIIRNLSFNAQKIISIFKQKVSGEYTTFAAKCVIDALINNQVISVKKLITFIAPKDHYKILQEYVDLYYAKPNSDNYKKMYSDGRNLCNIGALQEYGININAKDEDGGNIFHYLAINQDLNIDARYLSELAAVGVDFYTKDVDGNTPLFSALQVNNKYFLDVLTESDDTKNAIINDPCIYEYMHRLCLSITSAHNQTLLKNIFNNNPAKVIDLMLDNTKYDEPIIHILMNSGYFNNKNNINSIKLNEIVSNCTSQYELSKHAKRHMDKGDESYQSLCDLLSSFEYEHLDEMSTIPHKNITAKLVGSDAEI